MRSKPVSKSETDSKMSIATRRGFFGALGSLFKENKSPIRPPYASVAATFDECRSCEGMCSSACEENIIRRDEKGIPYLDFKIGGCSDCSKCLEACVPDVLNDPERFISAKVRINTTLCMAHNGTICSACKDPCLENAIMFKGLFEPIVIPDLCTGCGYCVAPCPTEAMVVYR